MGPSVSIRNKKPHTLRERDFPSRAHYYWMYQYTLAWWYLIPWIEANTFSLKGKWVLDVGCGRRGIAMALIDHGAFCHGVDKVNMDNPYPRRADTFKFIHGDINSEAVRGALKAQYDVIILRDVVEHIERGDTLIATLTKKLSPEGNLFFTFPPYYSPFGGHTQLLGKWWGYIPFVHLLPGKIIDALLSRGTAPDWASKEVRRLRNIRLTIRKFETILETCHLHVVHHTFFLLRPTFKIRYGIGPMVFPFTNSHIMREICVTGAFYLACRRN